MAYKPVHRTKRRRLQLKYGTPRTYARNRGIYAPRRPRAILSQGGVPSAANHVKGTMNIPPEVKWFEVAVTDPTTGNWSYLTTTLLAGIGIGSGPNQRVGRQIRMLGIAYRIILSNASAAGVAQPYTIDFILDKQPSGAAAPAIGNTGLVTNAVYTSVNRFDLPNIYGQDRYQFLRRIEKTDPNGVATVQSGVINIDKIVTYDASTLAIEDLVSNNILITMCSSSPDPGVSGIIRVLYVDA